jgi:hypothetical protein
MYFYVLPNYIVACRFVAMQRILSPHRWANWEAVFFTRPVRQLRAATIEELLGKVFSVRSVPRSFKQDKSRIQLVVRQSPDSKGVNT